MSGGLRTSVKGYLLAQRLTVASDPLLENEATTINVTAPLDLPLDPVEEIPMDSTTYGLSICDGNIPCFPMLLNSAKHNLDSDNIGAESSLLQGVNLNRNTSSPQTEGEILQSFNLKSFLRPKKKQENKKTNLKSFHYNELKTAASNFHPSRHLGEGSFGSLFKGWIDEHSFAAAKPGTGMTIAVKILNQQQKTLQDDKEWMKEVYCLGQLSHSNLVKMIGYCREDDIRLLAYELMPKGSLESHLFRRPSGFQTLSWNLRMQIALGAAKGLAYLHSDEAKCLYVDFKTSKILLDSNYNAKIYGYGLAQEGPKGYRTRILCNDIYGLLWYEDKYVHVGGRSIGGGPYAAPEYIVDEDNLCPRSDVYSFGVVLLEILTGQRAIDRNNRPMREHDLVQLAKTKISRKREVHRIIDIRMEGNYSKPGAVKAFKLAIQCVSEDPRHRPDMDQVVEILENLQSSSDEEASAEISQYESGQNLDHGSFGETLL